MITPVILEKTWANALKKIQIADKFAELIQIDFADDILVDGKTFLDPNKIGEIKTKSAIEMHLMVADPFPFIAAKIANVTKICTQIEAKADHNAFIQRARQLGYKVGLSVNPETDYARLGPYLKKLDYVQFMDIVPGKQGGSMIPQVINKIRLFREKFPKVRIQVDGGIKENNILQLVEAGVNDFVIGSAIFNSTNPKDKYVQFKNMTAQSPISTIQSRKIQKIAFLGGAGWKENEEPYIAAYDVAKLLAKEGYEIVNGGGPGVMKASTQGAHDAGARALAITYHPNKPKRHYEGVDPTNEFDEEIITLDYFDRTKVMLQTTQLHIVFMGSLGTLSEFGMSWISSWIHEPNNKPIILYGAFWNDFLAVIDKHMIISEAEKKILKVCTTPAEVLDYVRSLE